MVPRIGVRILAPQSCRSSPSEPHANMCSCHATQKRNCESRAACSSLTEVLRHFGLRPAGGNHRLLRDGSTSGASRQSISPGTPTRDAASRCRSRRCWSNARRTAAATEAASLRRGLKERDVRALRSGRGVARTPDVADPRPRQRRGGRQPSRESANRLPELRRHARHALRAAEPAARVEGACLHCGRTFSSPKTARQRYCSSPADHARYDRTGSRGDGWSDRRMSSWSRRWRRRAGARSDASTASATTRCASGCARTSANAEVRLWSRLASIGSMSA